MRRPTISDIARACGVSTTAVSFALNGKPGLSATTRAAIQEKALELGWTPSAAARALSTARADAIGLVVTAPFSALARDSFYLQLIAGIERELSDGPVALVLKMVESLEDEVAAIRAWNGAHRIDAVILVNPRLEDPRPELIAELGLPAVFIGDLRDMVAADGSSSVLVDEGETMRLLLRDAVSLGYRSVAYLHAHGAYRHTRERLAALRAAEADGMRVTSEISIEEAGGHRVDERVAAALDRLVLDGLPDLLLCEDEAITLAALTRLAHHGVDVPRDIGLISWEGTPGLTTRPPAVSSLDRDPMLLGAEAVRALASAREESAPVCREVPPPRLVLRDSLRRRVAPAADAEPV